MASRRARPRRGRRRLFVALAIACVPGCVCLEGDRGIAGLGRKDAASRTVSDEAVATASAVLTPTIPSTPIYPIDLTTSLRLAEAENPTIAEARARILEALAAQSAARAILLPSINGGGNYHDHTGPLQRASGTILPVTEQSFYFGGGARAIGSQPPLIPMMTIFSPLTDAIYEPIAAHRVVEGAKFAARATANDTLLNVATRFLDLLGAGATLEAQRMSEAQTAEVARVTGNFARQGQGRPADAARAEAETLLRHVEVLRAEEGVAVASARLGEQLSLDPAIRLDPILSGVETIDLVDLAMPTESLLQIALARRPEIGARGAEIGAAEARLTREKARPFLPTIFLGYSAGDFGGGSNLAPPTLGRFAGRTDFDARATWTILNFGGGNLALIRRQRAQLGEAVANRSRTVNDVRAEVTTAQVEAISRRGPVALARRKLASAEAGFNQDLDRTRQGLGRPIEVLDNLNELATARIEYIRAVVAYDQAQFRLFVALGSPPPLPPSPGPAGPPPIANELRSPIVVTPDPGSPLKKSR